MSRREGISRLKREIKVLEGERNALLEAVEDAHITARVAEEFNRMGTEGEIIDALLKSICVLKDLPYASFIEKRKHGFRVSREYVNAKVSSRLGMEFRETELPLLSHLEEKLPLSKPTMPLEALVFLPRPPRGKRVELYSLLPLHVLKELHGILVVCAFDRRAGFAERTVPLVERLLSMASSHIERLRLMREVEELNERLRKRLGRRRVELLESEERYRTLVESSPDLVAIHDEEKLLYINPAGARILGFNSPEEIEGRELTGLIHSSQEDEVKSILRSKHYRVGHKGFVEGVLRRQDGTSIHYELFSSPITYQGRQARQVVLRDITQRKRAENALRESEEKYRTLVEESQDAIVIVDESGRIVVFNRAAERMLGYTREEAIGRRPEELYIPEEHLARHGEGRFRGRTIEAQALRKNGEKFPIEMSFFTFTTAEGRFTGSIIRDITERKAAEEELRKSEEKFRGLMESSPDLIFIIHRGSGRIVEVNEAVVKALGYKREEIIGTRSGDRVVEGQREAYRKEFERLLRTGRYSGEFEVRKKGGGTIWVSVSGAVAGDYVYTIGHDITERKQAEEALRESEEKFRMLAERSPNMIFINKGGRVVYANARCEEVMGYTREELCSPDFDFLDLIAPESVELVKENFKRHMRGEEIEPYEYKLVTRDGREIIGIHTSKLIEYEGERAILGIITDITERKQAEEELKKNYALLDAVTEGTNDAFFVKDLEGRYLMINSFGAQIIGRPKEEILGKKDEELFPPEIAEMIIKDDRRVMEAGKALTIEEDMRIQGRRYNLQTTKRPYLDGQGNIIGIIGIARDITPRKQAEEALRESEEKYSTIVEKGNDGIVILQDGVFRFVNRKMMEMLGYSKEELIGQPFTGFISPRYRELVAERYRKRLKGEWVMDRYEIEAISKDGRTIPLEISASRIDYGGRPADMAIVRDITERKAAEEELRRRAKELGILNEVIRHVSSTLEPEEVFHRITESAARLIGGDGASLAIYDGEREVMTYPYHYNMPVRLRKVVAKKGRGLAEYVMKTGKPVIIADYPAHPRALQEFVDAGLVELAAVPLITRGRAFGALGVFGLRRRKGFTEHHLQLLESVGKEAAIAIENAQLYQRIKDFTRTLELKVAERTRELEDANRRLQEADRLKSVFLASMSHELRTPLNSIIGFTGILLQGMAGELNSEQRRQLEMVYSSAKHLLALINDLLDISKIEAGKMEVFAEEVHVKQAVEEVVKGFEPEIERKGLKLEMEVEECMVWTDERRFKQVLMNLVGNAVKFTEKGGIKISAVLEEELLKVSVSDTGVGIRKKDMPRLFQPFQQIKLPSGVGGEGTGLGLYLSKRIVEMLGGEIKAESRYKAGSCFTFTLPARYEEGARDGQDPRGRGQ